jgi:hypothetical protein
LAHHSNAGTFAIPFGIDNLSVKNICLSCALVYQITFPFSEPSIKSTFGEIIPLGFKNLCLFYYGW